MIALASILALAFLAIVFAALKLASRADDEAGRE